MIVLASEDIGNADPQALVGGGRRGPGGRARRDAGGALNLSQAAAYLALAPKSNASTHRDRPRARRRAARGRAPIRLRTCRTRTIPGAKQLGRGVGYEYPHNLPEGVSDQSLMPEGMEDRRYYEPTERGFEAELRERLVSLLRKQRKSGN